MLSQHYYLLHHNPTPSTEDLKRQCEARLEAVDAQARLEVVKERARKKIQMNALQARKAKVRKAQKVWEGRNAMNEGRERGGEEERHLKGTQAVELITVINDEQIDVKGKQKLLR